LLTNNPYWITAGNPIELDHDGPDDTTSSLDRRSLDSTSVGGQPGVCPFFGDLSSEIAVGYRHIDSASTEGVSDNQKADNLDYRSVNEESVDNGQRPQPAAHQRSDWSAPDGQIATGASECNSSGWVPPASAGNVYDVFAEFERNVDYDNREGLDNKLGTGQTPSSPSQAASTLRHSPLFVSGSARTGSTEISQVPSQTDGQGEPNSLP